MEEKHEPIRVKVHMWSYLGWSVRSLKTINICNNDNIGKWFRHKWQYLSIKANNAKVENVLFMQCF